MTDEAGGAVASSEPQTVSPEAPQSDAPAPAERSKEPARASIDRAFAALEGQDSAGASPAKPVKETKEQTATAPDTRERDESGRFKAKEIPGLADFIADGPKAEASTEKPAAIASEPPARFSADAKAAWKDAPAAVQAEINRAVKELEGGIQQHQAVLEPLKPWFNVAKQNNTTIHEALDRYVGLERALTANDPQQKLRALEDVFETAGISPRDYAAHILGQKPDQVQSQSDAANRELRREIAELKQQIGGVTTSIQERHTNEVKSQVMEFAKAHPRMDDVTFAGTVAQLIKAGMAQDLPSAYDMAERLNPAPIADIQPAAEAVATTKPIPDQTRKASLSVTGSPASGSNPVNRKAPATARESLDRSFASLGLG